MSTRHEIEKIKFGILSPKMIKDMAVMKITRSELYDIDGYPIEGGLMDLRLGVIDPGLRCRTCGGRFGECTGHFGYIELARPVINPLFVEIIEKFLNAFCPECGRLKIPPEKKEEFKKRIEEYKKLLKDVDLIEWSKKILDTAKKERKCPYCGKELKEIKFIKPWFFYEGENRLNPAQIRERLEKIKDDDLILIGIDPNVVRPEWMILTLLPIPPVTVRTSIILESGQRSEDDLTHILSMIIRANNKLIENINAGSPEHIIEDLWISLQYYVAAYINNELSGMPPQRARSGRPLKTLASRIKGKEGRLRRNLEGKRVNFSARTVISPDNYIDIDEVGVPYEVAMECTVPEEVTEWNLEELKELVRRGPNQYPGANYIITPEGKRKRITEENKEKLAEELMPGYIVERHLKDGDIALFNRQPSLHRVSIMGHRVKILPGKTFRIHLATTIPYNADFDGDEMNLHIPQTREAQAEARFLLSVPNHLIGIRDGLPIIGLIQTHISGLYILTKLIKKLRKPQVTYLLSACNIFDLPPPTGKDDLGEYWSGKDVFSALLPSDFNFKGKTATGDDIIIENGRLLHGWIDRNAVGSERGRMLTEIIKKYGKGFGKEFIWKASMLGIKTLSLFGSTVSLDHYKLPPPVKKEVKEIIKEYDKKIKELQEKYKKGELTPLPGRSAKETFEIYLTRALNEVRDRVEKIIVEGMKDKENFTLIMARSKARGDMLNYTMCAGIIGQMTVRGKRPKLGYFTRTLPHYKEGELDPVARGFVKHSFWEGMSPVEFFFAHMSGRDSLIDTHARTPISGYMYRRLSFMLQDVFVRYDGTVRDGWNQIIQFQYGEDSINPMKTPGGRLEIEKIIEEELKK